ncbi:MAG TPA: hypothetical protein DEB31_10145 [Clostridiales bacterium]|nr:hypothetical protein [Clostridiales bacterium]
MAVSPISSYSTTRITGLVSGMDTEALIEKAMKGEQMKYDVLFKNNTKLEWKRDAYTNINSMLQTFRNKYMSASSSSNLFAASAYKAFKINMSENKYVDIKATSGAQASRHSITSIKMAGFAEAEGTKYRSRTVSKQSESGLTSYAVTQGIELDAGTDANTKLTELRDASGNLVFEDVMNDGGDGMLSFRLGDATFTYELNNADANMTLGDLMSDVSGNADATAVMSLETGAGGPFIQIQGTQTGEGGASAFLKAGTLDSNSGVFSQAGGVFGTVSNAAGGILATNQLTSSTTLADWAAMRGDDFGFDASGNATFKINDTTITVNENDTVADMLSKVNGSGAGATMSMNSDGTFTIRGDSTGSSLKLENGTGNVFGAVGSGSMFSGITAGSHANTDNKIDRQTDTIASAARKMGVGLDTDASGNFSFSVNGKTFSFATNTTIQNMIDTVNGDSEANVTLSYSQITDSFVFSSKVTGDAAQITLANEGIVQAFGGRNSFFGIAEGTVSGSDAEITIDGETVRQASNSFVLDGMEFNLKSNMVAATEADKIDFSVSQDVDSVVDKVKTFVEEYNTLLDTLYGMVNEELDYDYEPLTEEQKEAMSDAEIETWEAEAKKGLLRNDSTIRSMLSELRSAMFEKVGDTGLSPFDIGFNTSSSTDQPGAMYRITFDEAKFREKIQENPDAVAKVMAAVSTSEDTATERAESGFISRLFNSMTGTESNIRTKSLVHTNEAIDENESRMEDMYARMYEMQERYYRQFAQMETLLAQYQSQSDWLTQQLSQL